MGGATALAVVTGAAAARPPLFDAHCHLHFSSFGAPLDDLVASAEAVGIRGAAVCATSPADWPAVAAAAEAHAGFVRPQYGIHPWWLTEELAANPAPWEAQLRAALAADPAAGVGETGLDKTRRAPAGLPAQRAACEVHLAVARDLGRPVSLHCVRAYGSLHDLLGKFRGSLPCCVLHGYRGPTDFVRRFTDLGCYVSIGGSPLDEAHADLIRAVPSDRLLLETDSPDQRPDPLALGVHAGALDPGEANVPANLAAVCARVAEILGLTYEEVARQTHENAVRVFGGGPGVKGGTQPSA